MQSRNDSGLRGSAPTSGSGFSGAKLCSHCSDPLTSCRSFHAPACWHCNTLPLGTSESNRRRIFKVVLLNQGLVGLGLRLVRPNGAGLDYPCKILSNWLQLLQLDTFCQFASS